MTEVVTLVNPLLYPRGGGVAFERNDRTGQGCPDGEMGGWQRSGLGPNSRLWKGRSVWVPVSCIRAGTDDSFGPDPSAVDPVLRLDLSLTGQPGRTDGRDYGNGCVLTLVGAPPTPDARGRVEILHPYPP